MFSLSNIYIYPRGVRSHVINEFSFLYEIYLQSVGFHVIYQDGYKISSYLTVFLQGVRSV